MHYNFVKNVHGGISVTEDWMVRRMDIELNYIEKGSGFPLILLHGNGESGKYFEHQIGHFSSSYRVIAVDTRGQGKSPRGTAPFTIGQFAKDLKHFMDGMGIKRAHILGFSDGGNIALTFAIRYGSYVDKLILNGANLNPKGVKPSVQLPICIGYGVVSFFSRFCKNVTIKKELLGLMVNQPNIPAGKLKSVEAQTLVLAGSRDMIRGEHSRQIAKELPNGTYCCLEGTHFIAHENPEAFNRAVETFLDSRKANG